MACMPGDKIVTKGDRNGTTSLNRQPSPRQDTLCEMSLMMLPLKDLMNNINEIQKLDLCDASKEMMVGRRMAAWISGQSCHTLLIHFAQNTCNG